MSKYYNLDDNGQPVPTNIMEWAFQEGDWRVGQWFAGDIQVSTVFLGLDHQWGDGPPILWETMVFGGELDQEQERYHTREETQAGHRAMIERVLKAQGNGSE